ncbi:aldehyde dehydrogenase family protein [Listeria grandensis]|uniref:Aldehyde dehydrogenase family protein n=1 Tax=Listeria grandensis TaxID=1494963 RepID=A0A7X0Y2B1_9LIST|nr:aldehyde dehydrogenase family protein [Listeria grandensis]MBC1935727.1 aldehyde dehydrogenase family protein [Listeria grandensis]
MEKTADIMLLPKVEKFLSVPQKLFINGTWVDSISGKNFETLNPATGETITLAAEAGEADIDLAVKAARHAFEIGEWSKLSGIERGNLINKLADLMEENKEELAQLDSLDNGKPIQETRNADVPLSIEHFRYYAGWASKIFGQSIPVTGDFLNYTRHEPIGVIGQIIPWNFPLLMAAWKLGAALATGCTVVLKPAEQTPLSALYLAKLSQEAGFPDGVLNIVTGAAKTGEALVDHPNVDKIAFTGSTKVGKHIMSQVSEDLKRVTLELGGKSPNIIFPDADLSRAIPGALSGIMFNQGQVCCAGSRLFVHRDILDTVVPELVAQAKKIQQGPGLDGETTMGPLISKKQQERVLNYIESGKKEGAEILIGGTAPSEKGFFVEPTIFTNVTDDMVIAKEEIFGPVVAILPFDTIDEVIERSNATNYGLAAGIWTENIRTAHRVAEKLEAGTVWINCYNVFDAASPFGGYKESGIGREMGSYALDNYTEVKSVWVNLQ